MIPANYQNKSRRSLVKCKRLTSRTSNGGVLEMAREDEARRSSAAGSIIGFIINIMFLLFFSLIVSVIIEWLGLYFNWWDFGIEHSVEMLTSELTYASHEVKEAFLSGESTSWLSITLQAYVSFVHFIFYWVLEFGLYISEDTNSIKAYTDSAVNIALVFGLRVLLIIASFPLFAMVFIWAFVDGLVERDLRRFGAGRESSTIFEGARKSVFPLLVIPYLIYLSFPTSINPMLIIAPSAIMQAILYRLLFSKYKKYL